MPYVEPDNVVIPTRKTKSNCVSPANDDEATEKRERRNHGLWLNEIFFSILINYYFVLPADGATCAKTDNVRLLYFALIITTFCQRTPKNMVNLSPVKKNGEK